MMTAIFTVKVKDALDSLMLDTSLNYLALLATQSVMIFGESRSRGIMTQYDELKTLGKESAPWGDQVKQRVNAEDCKEREGTRKR